MNCTLCKKEIPDNSVFCLYCGARVGQPPLELALLESRIEQLLEKVHSIKYYVSRIREKSRNAIRECRQYTNRPEIQKNAKEWFESFYQEESERIAIHAHSALALLSSISESPFLPSNTAKQLENICGEVAQLNYDNDEDAALRMGHSQYGLPTGKYGFIKFEIVDQFSNYASLFKKRS